MRRRSAICGFVRPSATSATTCCSVGVSAAQPWLGRFRSPRARGRVARGFTPIHCGALRLSYVGRLAERSGRRRDRRIDALLLEAESPPVAGLFAEADCCGSQPEALSPALRPPPRDRQGPRHASTPTKRRSCSTAMAERDVPAVLVLGRDRLDRRPHRAPLWRLARLGVARPPRSVVSPASIASRHRRESELAANGSRSSRFSSQISGSTRTGPPASSPRRWTARSAVACVPGSFRRRASASTVAASAAALSPARSAASHNSLTTDAAISIDGVELSPPAISRHRPRSPMASAARPAVRSAASRR